MSGLGEKRWYERVREAAKSDPWHGLDICELGIAEHPQSHGLHFLAGYIHVRLGKHRAAIWALNRATDLDGDHAASWRELARAQVALAESAPNPKSKEAIEAWVSAAESLSRFVGLRPGDAVAYLDRALALSHIDDRAAKCMARVDALCALSIGTLESGPEARATKLVADAASLPAAEKEELGRQLIDRVRSIATTSALQAARLAREAARVLDAKYSVFAAVLFADVGEVDQALHELGATLKAVGSNLNPLNVVAQADVPVSNPSAVANVWNIAKTKHYARG